MKTRTAHLLLRALGAGLALTSFVGAAADSPADYAGSVLLFARGSEALQRVELPQAVYAGVQHADLRDLRVFNAAAELVPFALAAEAPLAPAPNAAFSLPVFRLPAEPGKAAGQMDVRIEQRADGSVVSIRSKAPGSTAARPAAGGQAGAYIVDATRVDSALAAMTPQWRQAPDNYVGSARIEASDNLKDWHTLVASAPLAYLAQGQARLVQDRIEFAPLRSRYFRLVLTPAAPELMGLAAEAPSTRPEIRRQTLRVAGRAGAGPGEIEFDLAQRAPVDRVRLIVPLSNALAPVRLDARPEPRGEWRPVVSTVAYRIVRDAQELANPAASVAPNPSPHWRAVIDQSSGGFGQSTPEFEVAWPPRNLVFLARGPGPFTLAFGRRDALPVQLPLATLVPGYRDGAESSFAVAELGTVRAAPPPPAPILPKFIGDADPKKLGLWAALLVGVLVLAGMAWRLARQMKEGAVEGTSAKPAEPPKE